MQTYIPSKEEFQKTVVQAVEQAVANRLPEIIHKATQKKYYTIQDVCDLLDVSRRHLQYLRDTGQIGCIKNGRKVYFRAEDLEEFFEINYIPSDDKLGDNGE
ncbi:MAG: helix-turn-helix domain-containing protein [Balneolaceae bacterium]|nr:helix-turn-helix domain-containing protein [Balneolaceae bacterium]